LLKASSCQIACHFDDAGAKITFGIIMWTPLLPSTSSVNALVRGNSLSNP
jgi:hypothetical protein